MKWNEQGQLYFVGEEAHAILVKQNPTFTFKIGHAGGGGETVDIVLPYAAFDLNLTAPIVGNDTRWFPLKQAHNSTQYTLGRVFLQEAYVIADYERHNFSVSQASFPSTSVAANLVAIHPPGSNNNTTNDTASTTTKKGLQTGAMAGVAIAGVAIVALVAIAAFLWRRKKKRHELADTSVPRPAGEEYATVDLTPDSAKPELEGNKGTNNIHEMTEQHFVPPELPAYEGRWGRHELVQDDSIHEMEGDGVRLEDNKRLV